MKVYMDSSVLVARIFREPAAIRRWRWEHIVTSELTRVETFRTIDRFRTTRAVPDSELSRIAVLVRDTLAAIEIIPLGAAVLQRASDPFPTVIGTLDAIHLSTALVWTREHAEALTFLTHDRQLASAARACGLDAGPA